MASYIKNLNDWQIKNFPNLNETIQKYEKQLNVSIDVDLSAFEIEFLNFSTQDDFFTYLESESYLASLDPTTPVCYGF